MFSGILLAAPDVLVLHAGVDDTGVFGVENFVNAMIADGRFSSVSQWDADTAGQGLPTLADLAPYDAILATTDNRSGNPIDPGYPISELGDVLADYADTRGGVVIASFGFDLYTSGGIGLWGRIITAYSPLVPEDILNAPAGDIDLATADMSHPIMNGVGAFSSSFANYVSLRPGSDLVASYQNGNEMIAVNTSAGGRNVVGFNAFPCGQSDLGDPDYARAFANALLFAVEEMIMSMDIAIDIKPGSWPNAINLKSQGVIPVAVLTTSVAAGEMVDFDATTVDPMSVEFGPGKAKPSHEKGHVEDVDGDGDLDMVLHFSTPESGINPGDAEAQLAGEAVVGGGRIPIKGEDAIKIVGGSKPAPYPEPRLLAVTWAGIRSGN